MNQNQNNEEKFELDNKKLGILNKEKLISIILKSEDENLLYSIICKNNQIFEEIINNFVQEYPKYSKSNYFINGKEIDKNLPLDENIIYHNNIIIIKTK